MIIVTSSFSELSAVFRIFSVDLHQNAKTTFTNFSGLKKVLEKLRFHDGLVLTVGPTVEIKLRF